MDHATSSDGRSPARSTAGPDNDFSPPPDDLPACLSCRRRKSKCSRDRPSCAQCNKIGAECQYVVKQKPGIKAGAVDSLGRRLEVLEQILLDGTGNARVQLAALLGFNSGGGLRSANLGSGFPPVYTPSGHGQSQGSPGSSEGLRARANDYLADRGGTETDEQEHPHKRQRVSRAADDDDDSDDESWMPPLPAFPILEAVTEAHFQTIQHWSPVLHETRFRARLKDASQRKELTVLLHALIATALKYADFAKFGLTVSDVTKQIRSSRRAVKMHAMESLSLENAQALVILAFDYVGGGMIMKVWPIIGALTRIVGYLQLSNEPSEGSPEQPLLRPLTLLERSRDFTETEGRRRLFWAVFNLDRICSITSGWSTSLTAAEVCRRLPCNGGAWARSEPVGTPFFNLWDKSTAKIGNSIPTTPALSNMPHPKAQHARPSGDGDLDDTKIGAFAYGIQATENLHQVTAFFLRQSVNFADRQEVKDWLTRFKELDLRLVHWKMYLPKQWQDANVSRDKSIIKMDPNLTMAHISHNTCMILLHQHIAYPPLRWRGVVKLPSACSAETCHLAAVETASIVKKYLRYMGGKEISWVFHACLQFADTLFHLWLFLVLTGPSGIVSGQFAFCAFVAAKVLLVHWRSNPSHALAPEFGSLLHSLEAMSDKYLGNYRQGVNSTSTRPGQVDLAAGYAAQLQQWRSQCVNGATLLGTSPAEILCDARYYGFSGLPPLPSSNDRDFRVPQSLDRNDKRTSIGFEAYKASGVPTPAEGLLGASSQRSPSVSRLSTTYEVLPPRLSQPENASPQSQGGSVTPSPMGAATHNLGIMASGETPSAMLDGLSTVSTFVHNQPPPILEEDELTAMSHMLLGHQFLEMDRVITLQGPDFFNFEARGKPGVLG